MKDKKCIVMLSGGLDSRLAVKVMQEQGFDITAIFFRLPFECSFSEESIGKFSRENKIKLKLFNCTRGKLLREYLKMIREAKHGRGKGINPCIDCKIFMLRRAREVADKMKVNLVVTGEVLGERPMSQNKRTMNIIEEESGLKGRILRPLSAKLLLETDAERKKFVNREKLYAIHGRRRGGQIALANRFNISYPTPAGGCLLCEKQLNRRLKYLIERGLDKKGVKLVGIGRHFLIDNSWVVLGRDKKENEIIEHFGKRKNFLIIPKFIGPSAIIMDKCDKGTKEKINELVEAYSKKGSLQHRKRFEKWKL